MPDPNTSRDRMVEAIQQGDADAVDRLLAAEPGVAAASTAEGVPLVLLALYHRQPELADRIAAFRQSLDVLEAAALGRADAVVDALEHEPSDLESRSVDGFTPLHYAAFFGREAVVAELLARGADVRAVAANPSRVQPLHSAAAIGSTAICRRLLEAGADPNATQHGGFTPLMSAALHGVGPLVELLLDHGATPGLASDDGRTAGELAAQGGYAELAERLDAD